MIELIVDIRENKIIELLSSEQNNFSLKMLDLGDFLLKDDKYFLLIERKTWSDLHSSIIDSRFREQRSRLKQWKTEHQKCVYVVEGSYSEEYKKERRTLERLMIGHDIPVFFTDSIEDTTKLLSEWTSLESLDKLFYQRSIEEDQIEARLHHVLKKNYSDSSLFFMETLCSLKGVTSSMAKSIGNTFFTLSDFVTLFHTNTEKWENDLKSITYKTPKDNDKKLSKVVIDKIVNNFGLKK